MRGGDRAAVPGGAMTATRSGTEPPSESTRARSRSRRGARRPRRPSACGRGPGTPAAAPATCCPPPPARRGRGRRRAARRAARRPPPGPTSASRAAGHVLGHDHRDVLEHRGEARHVAVGGDAPGGELVQQVDLELEAPPPGRPAPTRAGRADGARRSSRARRPRRPRPTPGGRDAGTGAARRALLHAPILDPGDLHRASSSAFAA